MVPLKSRRIISGNYFPVFIYTTTAWKFHRRRFRPTFPSSLAADIRSAEFFFDRLHIWFGFPRNAHGIHMTAIAEGATRRIADLYAIEKEARGSPPERRKGAPPRIRLACRVIAV